MSAIVRLCLATFLVLTHVAALADTHVIVIENMRYTPASLTIKRGDRVVWENKDLFPHTATADTNAFDSDDLPSERSWAWDAEKLGDYAYHCAYHPMMTARLIVR